MCQLRGIYAKKDVPIPHQIKGYGDTPFDFIVYFCFIGAVDLFRFKAKKSMQNKDFSHKSFLLEIGVIAKIKIYRLFSSKGDKEEN